MEIKRFNLYKPVLKMETPFVTSLREVSSLETVLVEVETKDGPTGWGEAPISPPVTGETPGSVLATMDMILPNLIGADPGDREKIHAIMDRLIEDNTAAKASVDIALHDLLGRLWGVPVWKILGGSRSRELSTDYTIVLAKPAEMAKKASNLVSEGFNVLKVKLGENVDLDLERLEKITGAVGEKIKLRIDANQGWSRTEALFFMNQLDCEKVQFVEQPISADDLEGMRYLRDNSDVPILADESVHGPESALEVVRRGAADFLNIKLSKCGGFWPALKVADVAESAHVPCMVGGMSSTNVLATAATHLAAGRDIVRFRDLDMGTQLTRPVIAKGGSYLKGNKRVLSRENGLGIEQIDREVIGSPVKTYET